MIERPQYVNEIMKYMDKPFVKILTGVRRCGKLTIMLMIIEQLRQKGIQEKCILHYNFDSLQYENIKNSHALYEMLSEKLKKSKNRVYLFFDEIQEVQDWEKVVNSLMIDFDTDIYVTGSNSRMMSSEIATYLTGRYISFHIYPLSFREYLTFTKQYRALEDTYKEFLSYVTAGGFPATHLYTMDDEERYAIVKYIYNSTIFSDIVKRAQIRKVDQLERIVKYVFDNVGNTFSASNISKYLKSQNRSIHVETIYEYLKCLENAYIIQRCARYDIKGKEILKTQEKFYLADPAFQYSVLGYRMDSFSNMLENIVYLELRRKGYDVYVGKIDTAEIDFVAIKRNEKVYIQITQEISQKTTQEREYGNLLEIHDNYPKYVLRTDTWAKGNYEGIHTMHIADFLLLEKY